MKTFSLTVNQFSGKTYFYTNRPRAARLDLGVVQEAGPLVFGAIVGERAVLALHITGGLSQG